jgi:hypothetical protein
MWATRLKSVGKVNKTRMDKFCVFCGESPENKNKEHVIPQWLIRMTGYSKRIALRRERAG